MNGRRTPSTTIQNTPVWRPTTSRVACPHEWGGRRVPRWWSLRPYWAWLAAVAAERDAQKRPFATSRYWNNDSHFIGLLGELVYALETDQAPDVALRIDGDQGEDFERVDVKTCVYWRDPYLKHPVNAKWWPASFALVILDQEEQRGMLVGVVDAERVRQAPVRDWGHGPQYSLRGRECLNEVPADTCRRCGGRRPGEGGR